MLRVMRPIGSKSGLGQGDPDSGADLEDVEKGRGEIWVVDDEPAVRELVRFMVSAEGYRVETFAETGGRPLGLPFDAAGRLLEPYISAGRATTGAAAPLAASGTESGNRDSAICLRSFRSESHQWPVSGTHDHSTRGICYNRVRAECRFLKILTTKDSKVTKEKVMKCFRQRISSATIRGRRPVCGKPAVAFTLDSFATFVSFVVKDGG